MGPAVGALVAFLEVLGAPLQVVMGVGHLAGDEVLQAGAEVLEGPRPPIR